MVFLHVVAKLIQSYIFFFLSRRLEKCMWITFSHCVVAIMTNVWVFSNKDLGESFADLQRGFFDCNIFSITFFQCKIDLIWYILLYSCRELTWEPLDFSGASDHSDFKQITESLDKSLPCPVSWLLVAYQSLKSMQDISWSL